MVDYSQTQFYLSLLVEGLWWMVTDHWTHSRTRLGLKFVWSADGVVGAQLWERFWSIVIEELVRIVEHQHQVCTV